MSEPESDADVHAGRLRETYRARMREGAADSCPDDEELAALALGELEAEARLPIADHVVRCERCAESYRLLQELHAEARPRRRPFWTSTPVRVLAAAVLLIGLGLLLRGTPRSTEVPEVSRGEEASATPRDQAELAAPPESLSWPAELGASGYRVRLFDASAEPLWESAVIAETSLALPPDVISGLRAGASYFWTVEIQGLPERTRQGPFWFHLERPR